MRRTQGIGTYRGGGKNSIASGGNLYAVAVSSNQIMKHQKSSAKLRSIGVTRHGRLIGSRSGTLIHPKINVIPLSNVPRRTRRAWRTAHRGSPPSGTFPLFPLRLPTLLEPM